jgi:pyruvyltransferase
MTVHLKQFTVRSNAGDAASAVIVRHFLQDTIRIVGPEDQERPNLIAIGSILQWADKNSIIWGSGLLQEGLLLKTAPRAILAVRGPLTRASLKSQGIDCTDILGDPGVLIPDVLPFPQSARTGVGVVPHYCDVEEAFVARARTDGAVVIDPRWPLETYLAALTGCASIISSSLHGLVFAHAYGIPAVWVKLSERVLGDGFKFRDYFGSVGLPASCRFGPADQLDTVLKACELPIHPIHKAALTNALVDARSLLVSA